MTTGSQRLCPQCGGRLLGGDRFCAHCGAPQDDSHPGLAEPAAAAAWGPVLEELRVATAGKYEIGRMLGAGGMAAVFLGREIKLPRRVAIKVMSPALMLAPGMVERFQREAATVAALNHPHIVTIYTVDETERLQYFVMKYVGGPSLEDVIQKHGSLPVPVATAWLTQIAGALGYAHRRGVIHRDVKPGNMLLDEEGSVVVTDFGIAKVVRERSLTQVGATVGTPAYMSPEQCLSREVTAASDQYALGVVAYEMLTGEPPFTGPSLEVMQAHVQQRPPPIAVTRPDCPGDFQAAIARMLAKDPAERFLSMEDVIGAIGGRPLGHDDPLRFQLADLAGGRTPSLVAPISGARSPVPAPRSPVPVVRSPVASPVPVAAPPARVASLEVSPAERAVTIGRRARLRATPRGADGRPLEDRPVRWASSDPVIATVSDDGVVRGLEPGAVTVTAECEDQTGAATIEVAESDLLTSVGRYWHVALAAAVVAVGGWYVVKWILAPPAPSIVASVTVLPPRSSISVGGSLTLSALVQDTKGTALPGTPLQWRSSEARVASVTDDGLVTAVAAGEARITATAADGTTGTATVTVTSTAPVVAAINVTPPRHTAAPGGRFRLVARAVDAGGLVLGDRVLAWSSSDSAVATVTSQGEVSALGVGTATITAATDGREGSAEVTVAPARVGRIVLGRSTLVMEVGASYGMQATVADEQGRPLGDRLVTWESTDPTVANVTPDGTVRALAPGRADIVARSEDQSTRATLTVIAPTGMTVRVTLGRGTARVGDSVSAAATLVDPRGPAPAAKFVWSVSDTGIARVSAVGLVIARAPGSVTVMARTGATQGAAVLTVLPGALTLSRVSAGGRLTCGVSPGGDGFCWGLNDRGQVVPGGPAARPVAVPRSGRRYVSVSTGAAHACGIMTTGAVECWGNSDDGRLGTKLGSDYRVLAAGEKHTCALRRGGGAVCWGSNERGQLGTGSQEGSREPRALSVKIAFDTIVAGGQHSCALDVAGAAYCWGSDWSGQVGSGNVQVRSSVRLPTAVAGGLKFRAISAGDEHTCGLTGAGTVFCWGGNKSGQVGDGSAEDRFRAVAVAPSLRFAALSAGGAHTCALTTGGQAYCWGRNDSGQLGTGSTRGSMQPLAIGGATRFTTISAGGAHTCGVTTAGEVQCWGDNHHGQLGDGSQTNRPLPVATRGAEGR